MKFFDGAEFVSNVGTGYGGALLNHAKLEFKGEDGSTFRLVFEGNYCGEKEVSNFLGETPFPHGMVANCDARSKALENACVRKERNE